MLLRRCSNCVENYVFVWMGERTEFLSIENKKNDFSFPIRDHTGDLNPTDSRITSSHQHFVNKLDFLNEMITKNIKNWYKSEVIMCQLSD